MKKTPALTPGASREFSAEDLGSPVFRGAIITRFFIEAPRRAAMVFDA